MPFPIIPILSFVGGYFVGVAGGTMYTKGQVAKKIEELPEDGPWTKDRAALSSDLGVESYYMAQAKKKRRAKDSAKVTGVPGAIVLGQIDDEGELHEGWGRERVTASYRGGEPNRGHWNVREMVGVKKKAPAGPAPKGPGAPAPKGPGAPAPKAAGRQGGAKAPGQSLKATFEDLDDLADRAGYEDDDIDEASDIEFAPSRPTYR